MPRPGQTLRGRLSLTSLLVIGLTGCGTLHQQRLGIGEVPTLIGPPVRDNRTPMDAALSCIGQSIAGRTQPLVIAVGDVRDYTGKYSVNEGNAITQGGALMVSSALGKLGRSVALAERFDPTIAERELGYADHRQLGDGQVHNVIGTTGVNKVPWLAVVNHQSMLGAPVDATIGVARTALEAGSVNDSKLALSANTQDAAALGNDGSNTMSLAGVSSDSGAGIVSVQNTDAASTVSAFSGGQQTLSAQSLDASALDLSANLSRATSYGNTVDNALSAKLVHAAVPGSEGIASIVPVAGDGDAAVGAAFSVLSSQSVGSDIVASAGNQLGGATFRTLVDGSFSNSSASTTNNMLSSGVVGNQSGNTVNLDADALGVGTNGTTGPIANVTNVQRVGSAFVAAAAVGSTDLSVHGDVEQASLLNTGNAVRTTATGNRADGNLLTVRANQAGTHAGGSDRGPILVPAGTALVDSGGSASTTAALSVQNVQDYGSDGVAAASALPYFTTSASGAIRDSSMTLSDNVAASAATGNDATNGLTLDVGRLRSSADLNNVQSGSGDVVSKIAGAAGRGGAVITPGEQVAGSTLALERNASSATSIGNAAANTVDVAATTLSNGSGHTDAVAGPIGSGYGAAATLALANDQMIGRPTGLGTPSTRISSWVNGAFGVSGHAAVSDSSISVADNIQRATAVANTGTNALTVAATSISGAGGPAAGTALSSTQFGQADVHAVSAMKLAANGNLAGSTATIADNASRSVAVVNDVDNRLDLTATGAGSLTGTAASGSANAYGPPHATGDQALANQQFASGSVDATSSTLLTNGDGGRGLNSSQLTVTGNLTRADATANQAVNALSATATTGDARSSALTGTQMNVAGVSATANATMVDATYAAWTPSVTDSGVTFGANTTAALARGNVADNAVSLTGTNNPSPVPAVYASRYASDISAQAALLNGQTNMGSVSATAISTPPLNSPGLPALNSTIGVTGNTVSATAFGNVASNAASVSGLGRLPTAAIANVQSNGGAITAQVSGASYSVQTGALSRSALTLSGNQLVAAATGNQATNVITSVR